MGLKAALLRGKLHKFQRKAKKYHGLQRRYRRFIEELEQQKKDGTIEQGKYEKKRVELQAKRHAMVEKLKVVEEQERQVRGELKAL